MNDKGTVRLRDRRLPGHGWFDNEVYDVFGDELRQDGISVYMTLTRLCYGVSVCMSLREMAGHARMSKDTFSRNLKRVIGIGLVIERKGPTPQSPSVYDLVDVKALAVDYLRAAEARRRGEAEDAAAKVSCYDGPTLVELITGGKSASGSVDDTDCLTVRQRISAEDNSPKKICAAQAETLVSQTEPSFETEVSQAMRHRYRQDTTLTKTPNQHQNPQPRSSRGNGFDSEKRAEEQPSKSEPVSDTASIERSAAVAKVMRECNLSERRIARAIERAMSQEASKADAPADWNAIAEHMIRNQRDYASLAARGCVRYTVRMTRFFGEMWRNDGLWAIDHERMRAAKRF